MLAVLVSVKEGLWHVYCDMDGVLSDFERGVSELLGSPPDEFRDSDAVAEMWGKLAAEANFFSDLPWMPGGSPPQDVQTLKPRACDSDSASRY